MKTIIIGMGNPFLTDDGVGGNVVRMLRESLNGRREVDLVELYVGGLRLMETMIGYEKAIIVDAMLTGKNKPGVISSYREVGFTTKNTISTHDTNLSIALEMGKLLNLSLPDEIRIWGIEANDVETFSEDLTLSVAEAVPIVVKEILQNLKYWELGIINPANSYSLTCN
ncbi:MAG: hypothetical protein IEMM0008_1421 [bacterium]|nr:MAG: hypothetical protein IEMM0008_1421 [bacterium]